MLDTLIATHVRYASRCIFNLQYLRQFDLGTWALFDTNLPLLGSSG